MTNDTATTRLLYAILSQKCLKDIDWNKVAHDPILSQEISNGHAARMRYSRFKKQMEGTTSPKKPRNPVSPRKSKVEKNKSPGKKGKERKPSDDEEKIKAENEEAGEVGSSQETVDNGPEPSVRGLGLGLSMSSAHSPMVKREPGMRSTESMSAQYPITPSESHGHSETPSPGFGATGDMSDMDEMVASFGMPQQSIYQGYMAESTHGYGMGMHMGMGDPYEGMWQGEQQQQQDVAVKSEPRWEEAYRHQQI
ncbi:hypothetical protein B0O99DRAFT_209778 [Bisporella sp. PMI_857]|nr:hypothetical protein B0O99DRAFT_209778 [Bisporella sp. PMI_857]